MNKEFLGKGAEMQDAPIGTNYQRYMELGGIINEMDYESALRRSRDMVKPEKSLIREAENIAKFAKIELSGSEGSPDKIIILYGILRSDIRTEKAKRHHDEMSDQRIFMEALRMLEDAESVDKMIKAYPQISF